MSSHNNDIQHHVSIISHRSHLKKHNLARLEFTSVYHNVTCPDSCLVIDINNNNNNDKINNNNNINNDYNNNNNNNHHHHHQNNNTNKKYCDSRSTFYYFTYLLF